MTRQRVVLQRQEVRVQAEEVCMLRGCQVWRGVCFLLQSGTRDKLNCKQLAQLDSKCQWPFG